jgi:hypothetical protein
MKNIVAVSISVVLGLFFYYFFMPVLSIDYISTMVFIGLTLYPCVAIMLYNGDRYNNSGTVSVTALFAGVAVVYVLISLAVTHPIVHSDRYQRLIGNITNKDFKHALPPIDVKIAPLVSEEMAHQVAQKKLS